MNDCCVAMLCCIPCYLSAWTAVGRSMYRSMYRQDYMKGRSVKLHKATLSPST